MCMNMVDYAYYSCDSSFKNLTFWREKRFVIPFGQSFVLILADQGFRTKLSICGIWKVLYKTIFIIK